MEKVIFDFASNDQSMLKFEVGVRAAWNIGMPLIWGTL